MVCDGLHPKSQSQNKYFDDWSALSCQGLG